MERDVHGIREWRQGRRGLEAHGERQIHLVELTGIVGGQLR
jgi:hypothetical protein